MNELIPIGTKQTMTSLEVAELTGKKHKHVMRDIKSLIEQGAVNGPSFGLVEYKDAKGEQRPMYNLDFQATMVLITGYDAKRRAIVVDRWLKLETGEATPAFMIPQTYPEALRALANEVEMKELAMAQRDEAIKTKSYISDKKTATAMATASVAVRKVLKLENELGHGRDFKCAKTISWVQDHFALSKGMWIVLGKKLKAISDEMGIPIKKVDDSKYGSVNAYHVDVIEKLRVKIIADDNMLGKYRLCEAAV